MNYLGKEYLTNFRKKVAGKFVTSKKYKNNI